MPWAPTGSRPWSSPGQAHRRPRDSISRGLPPIPSWPTSPRLDRLKFFMAPTTYISDGDLVHLRHLSRLEAINLHATAVKGPGLVHLRGLTRLKTLVMASVPVGDEDLGHLANLDALEVLWLDSPRITDAGLAHLAGLTNLHHLLLNRARITEAGLVQLRVEAARRHRPPRNPHRESAPLLNFADLEAINVQKSPIDDAGLAPIAGLGVLRMSGWGTRGSPMGGSPTSAG